MNLTLTLTVLTGISTSPCAGWKVLPATDQRQPVPEAIPANSGTINPGDNWPQDDKFRWLIGDVSIPESVDGQPTAGRVIGMQINCGDGGEVYVNGELQTRYDNDHPALAVVSENAQPGAEVRVAVQVYPRVQGGDRFGEAKWVIIDADRARKPVALTIDPAHTTGNVPDGIIGLSQGGGLADYDDATAAKLREGGFKWFRMDNILTPVVKEENGKLAYDWSDFDRRVDFIVTKMGAEPIFAVSYMPIPFDAVANNDRQSAPKDYALWEDLCYRAAKRCVDRGKRVPWWEVWNEVNTGWLKPGPNDTGTDAFKKLYSQALGQEQTDHEVIRRFEAYCKLYQATARGVLRADPKARIGGPALASGPFEHEQCGHCFHGKGFARGLMLFCRDEKLPLDFVSWHEYFQPADVFARQVDAFREYLSGFPEFRKSVRSFMITEWNEAWWADRPQDHEVGAAWCANCITRVFIPKQIDRPCFFYVKQNDMSFRGDFSLLMQNNTPKPTYNALKIFNHLSGKWVEVAGGDDDVSAVAAWDAQRGRLAIVLVNFRDRYALRRNAKVMIDRLPASLEGGQWREWIVDVTHSNVWHDRDHAELTPVRNEKIDAPRFTFTQTLMPNSVTLLELQGRK